MHVFCMYEHWLQNGEGWCWKEEAQCRCYPSHSNKSNDCGKNFSGGHWGWCFLHIKGVTWSQASGQDKLPLATSWQGCCQKSCCSPSYPHPFFDFSSYGSPNLDIESNSGSVRVLPLHAVIPAAKHSQICFIVPEVMCCYCSLWVGSTI